jgi:hypothetical protein
VVLRRPAALPNASAVPVGWRFVGCAALVCALACQRAQSRSTDTAGAANVTVTKPTVIAYFVIPPGAVDTLADLAVEADDWNVSMATLGDSLEASGIALAMVTEPRVRVSVQGRPDTTLELGAFRASGYVFVRPGAPPCMRAGGADADSVKVMARAHARGGGCG